LSAPVAVVRASPLARLERRLAKLGREARACRLCASELPHEPRPTFRVDTAAPILVTGQAPGRRVHETGLPWNDASGDRLREWLGVDRAAFYDTSRFAILPIGLCWPGTVRGKGDLPPIARCAPQWQPRFHELLAPQLRLHLLVGSYATAWYLPDSRRRAHGEVVAEFRAHLARGVVPLPHPSPRNRRWLRDRPWFDRDLVPELRESVARALRAGAKRLEP